MLYTEYPIDFVVPWVDGNDPRWQKEKNQYLPENMQLVDAEDSRFRDWGFLKYWFRSVERFAPWVNRIFFVTCGQIPDWLNLDEPKLVYVKHSDYIPQEYLPTFSSHPIELNLHRIDGLSEHFVYFNDDLLITKPVNPELFFRSGIPVYSNVIKAIIPRPNVHVIPHIYINETQIINDRFDAREVIKKNLWKWFSPEAQDLKGLVYNMFFSVYQHHQFAGIENEHLGVPLLKSTMETVWHEIFEVLDETSKHKFRDVRDVSQRIFRYWQIANDSFIPIKRSKLGHYYVIEENTRPICQAIIKQKYNMVCLNDMDRIKTEECFIETQKEIIDALEKILPEKSSFER